MKVYDVIRHLCKEKGITVTALEKELGFARGSLSKIDKNKPSMERVRKLAYYFNVPTEVFAPAIDKSYIKYQEKIANYKNKMEMYEEMVNDKCMLEIYHIKKHMNRDKFNAHFQLLKDFYKLEHPEDTEI